MTFRYTIGMAVQIAVKLPEELAEELDRLVQGGSFDNRSQAIRAGLEAIVAVHARQEVDARYRDAAARHPETVEEIADARRLAEEAIAEEPWERWW